MPAGIFTLGYFFRGLTGDWPGKIVSVTTSSGYVTFDGVSIFYFSDEPAVLTLTTYLYNPGVGKTFGYLLMGLQA